MVRQFAVLWLVLLAGCGADHGSEQQPPGREAPNVLLIVVDDLGFNDLGANGNQQISTPNLDTLARQGVRYTRHYSDATCSVARAALLTGVHPAANGFRPSTLGLSPDTVTIASTLRDAGYGTQHLGKWHVGNPTLDYSPASLGFDDWFGFLYQMELGGLDDEGQPVSRPTYRNPWLREGQAPPVQHKGHLTDILSDRAVAFVERKADSNKPWFLNLWYFAPHNPVQPSPDFAQHYPDTPEGRYRALVEQLDFGLGRVLSALDSSGQAERTLVIVVSDNGGTNRHTDNNYPYHGRKNQFLEGGLRTPLLIRWPGQVEPGGVSDEVVSILDLFPTIASAAFATPSVNLHGRDLMRPGAGAPRPLYWEYSTSEYHSYSVLSADGAWRYTRDFGGGEFLFDLESDPSGELNVIGEYRDIADSLVSQYLAWRDDKRVVDVKLQTDGKGGRATAQGRDLLRSPGHGAFTFAIALKPNAGGAKAGVIAQQGQRWRLERQANGSLRLNMLGNKIAGPVIPDNICSRVVVSSHFMFSPINPSANRSLVNFYVDGLSIAEFRDDDPVANEIGYELPTYIGSNPRGSESFPGLLGEPVFLNERVVPAEDGLIGNGVHHLNLPCPGESGTELKASRLGARPL